MTAEVRIPCSLRKFSDGQAVLLLPTDRQQSILQLISEECPNLHANIFERNGELRPFVKLCVNQVILTSQALNSAEPQNGDVIDIISAVAGG